MSGALEAGETILEGTLREVHEELGSDIQVRPLGTVHLETFQYDEQVQYMLGSYYLFTYAGGKIIPGDDMAGSLYRWWTLVELGKMELNFSSIYQILDAKTGGYLAPFMGERNRLTSATNSIMD